MGPTDMLRNIAVKLTVLCSSVVVLDRDQHSSGRQIWIPVQEHENLPKLTNKPRFLSIKKAFGPS
jgi:hypothetical protein